MFTTCLFQRMSMATNHTPNTSRACVKTLDRNDVWEDDFDLERKFSADGKVGRCFVIGAVREVIGTQKRDF